ncbi:MAG: BRO family protein, partial [Cetobacterium sp.]
VIKNGFTNERLGVELDVYVIGGKEWFKAQDISEYLDYEDTNKMTRTVEITGTNSCRHAIQSAQGNKYNALFIDESGFSEIIQRSRKIDKNTKTELLNSLGLTVLSCLETEFGTMLEEALGEIDLEVIPQFNIDGYKVDFYIRKFNIVIEYDEKQHYTLIQCEKDADRQRYIEDKIGAKFIRCDYRDSNIKNIMKVLKEVM